MVRNKFILSLLFSASILFPAVVCADELSILFKLAQGQEFEKSGKYQEAIEVYEKAMREDPRNAHVYMSIGHIYQYKLNDKKKAIEFYKRGLAYAPNDHGMSLNIMYAYFDVGDFDNAIKTYKMLSKMDHESFHSFPRDALNEIIVNMSDEKVIDFCKKYLSINSKDIILREKLSDVYMKRKEYEKARAEYDDRLKSGREKYSVGRIYFSLAVCDYYLGQYQNSLDYFTKAKDLGQYVPDQYFEMILEKIRNK